MIDLNIYLTFIAASLLIIATPGPSVLFIIARSIHLGVKGGTLSVLGVASGALIHAIAVSIGLAKIFESSPIGFEIIKNIGCIYLLYLGLRTILCDKDKENSVENTIQSKKRILIQGCFVELLNPKTALFFIAFLPQFTTPSKGSIGIQLLFLGITFVAIGLFSDSLYALLSGRIGHIFKKSSAFRKVEKHISGTVYCGLGITGFFYRIPEKIFLSPI